MELENYTLSSPGFQRLVILGIIGFLGRCPRLTRERAPLALQQKFLFADYRRFAGQSVNQARLHHINIDLGNMVLMQLSPHFMLQTRWVHSIWEVQEKYHASFVLVK